jgi:hypothetical protein
MVYIYGILTPNDEVSQLQLISSKFHRHSYAVSSANLVVLARRSSVVAGKSGRHSLCLMKRLKKLSSGAEPQDRARWAYRSIWKLQFERTARSEKERRLASSLLTAIKLKEIILEHM